MGRIEKFVVGTLFRKKSTCRDWDVDGKLGELFGKLMCDLSFA